MACHCNQEHCWKCGSRRRQQFDMSDEEYADLAYQYADLENDDRDESKEEA